MVPKTQFTRSGDLHIAYQAVGNGPLDLVYVPGWIRQNACLEFGSRGKHILKGVPDKSHLFAVTNAR